MTYTRLTFSRNGIDGQAFLIDWHADHVSTKRAKEEPDLRVSRLLHNHTGTRCQEHPTNQIECLLRSAGNDDVLGVSTNAAIDRDVSRDRGAKASHPRRLPVTSVSHGDTAEFMGKEPPPGRHGEEAEIGRADAEVVADRARARLRPDGSPDGAWMHRAGRRSPPGLARGCQIVCNERARSNAANQHAVRREPLVCNRNGTPCHAQAPGEIACGREPFPGMESAIEHGFEDLTVDLVGKVAPTRQRDIELTCR